MAVPAATPPPDATAAAVDNARWCHTFAHLHGVTGTFADDAWTSVRRTPPLYPDAVTVRRGVEAADLMARVDAGPGCSVKDSFADLDLSAHGLGVLLDASWIGRPGAAAAREPDRPDAGEHGVTSARPDPLAFEPVTRADELARWADAWGEPPEPTFFPPALLDLPDVTVLVAATPDGVRAGCVLTGGPGTVVGVSNLFTVDVDPVAAWDGVVDWCARHRPGAALVGYESGPDLDAARAAGFRVLGPLRVWLAP